LTVLLSLVVKQNKISSSSSWVELGQDFWTHHVHLLTLMTSRTTCTLAYLQ